MKLFEQIEGHTETDVQNKYGRMRLYIDRFDVTPMDNEVVYDVTPEITITDVDVTDLSEVLKDLYSKLPVEFLSAVESGDLPTFMKLQDPKSIMYKLPDSNDYMNLENVVKQVVAGIFRIDEGSEQFLSAINLFFRNPIKISTDIMQWYDNVKRSIRIIEPHIRRLRLENVETSVITDPSKKLSQNPFTYKVKGRNTKNTINSEKELEKYNSFLSSLLSEYGVTVSIEILWS